MCETSGFQLQLARRRRHHQADLHGRLQKVVPLLPHVHQGRRLLLLLVGHRLDHRRCRRQHWGRHWPFAGAGTTAYRRRYDGGRRQHGGGGRCYGGHWRRGGLFGGRW
uniref:(northern house mosquito) hypothetical protein n=1 Tax=Culex pipiens TaxID=7175 RepID=A0A8D8CAR8_CULPI